MRRLRRRMLGLTAAIAAHLFAGLALLPVVRDVADRAHPPNASEQLTIVQLIQFAPRRQATVAPQPPRAPKSKSMSLPEEDVTFEAALSDPEAPGPSAPDRPEDNDPLYRAPFRDAVAHADARLRAGLSCAHVDLQQLPRTLLDLCAAASKLKGGPLG